MKYYLIAGEASGDLHASNLMVALKQQDAAAEFRFFGGDLMQAVGGTLVKHYREMAYMGFIPVLLHARTILRNLRDCKEDIRAYQPDRVILIDFPGFNLKIAQYVKTVLHRPVSYYISPKIWAWKQYRIRSIRRYVDQMLCILPFEREFYAGLHYPITYVGNPSVDSVAQFRTTYRDSLEQFRQQAQLASDRPIVAILAGSRRQEIRSNLPLMLQVAADPRWSSRYQWVIAGAPGIEPAFYQPYLPSGTPVQILFGQTYPLLQHSQLALVTSGTATLETALFRVPQVVCYAVGGGSLANFVFRHFFHTPFISLVNLIAGREVVQELFGGRFTLSEVSAEFARLNQPDYRCRMEQGYDEMMERLGDPGAAQRAAAAIVSLQT
ncbi:lipid-A-disaccharide synthase [Parabacteroides distasonis]|nr:lipid-A-disaccharide synthase [Parabacteroides distasonis]